MSRVINLLCEYASNPIGVDADFPLFSWVMEDDEKGQCQTAYNVLVADSLDSLDIDVGNLWDSGKVFSKVSSGVQYDGASLTSGQTCFWKVKIWDRHGDESAFGDVATFEMGLLKSEDWMGKWIGPAGGFNGSSILLRREFAIGKRVSKARAYFSGLGYSELRLNGEKVGDHVLDPGTTDYSKRVLYCSYDVTSLLMDGRNVVGIVLGNGWYGAPKAILQMNIDFEDGTRDVICTKWDWGAGWYMARGPIVYNSIFEGELYDARLEKYGWDTDNFILDTNDGWSSATMLDSPGGMMVSQVIEPIKVVKYITPISTTRLSDKISVYDIGQNMAGCAQLDVKGDNGTIVSMKYAECLYDNGMVNQENLRLATSKDTYILRGDHFETYTPRFTYHGFRYVQVEVESGNAEILLLTAQVYPL